MYADNPRLWLAVTLWWTIHGFVLAFDVLNLGAMSASQQQDLDYAFRAGLTSAWLWIPLTVPLIVLTRRFPIERGRWLAPLLLHSIAVVSVIVLRATAVYLLDPWVGWYDAPPAYLTVLLSGVANKFLTVWLIVGAAHALLYYARAAERERTAVELEGKLATARLQALAQQLNPHFLFNALNSVSELVHHCPASADRMLVALGKILRENLDGSGVQQVPLRDEIALLEQYVELEKLRLEDRLRMHWDIDRTLLASPVPRVLLQPLVENAIRHAIAARIEPGKVVVSARRRGGRMVLEVRDDGPGPNALQGFGHGNGNGIGLSNTLERLRALYGSQYEFRLARTDEDDGTVAQVVLPIRMHEPAA